MFRAVRRKGSLAFHFSKNSMDFSSIANGWIWLRFGCDALNGSTIILPVIPSFCNLMQLVTIFTFSTRIEYAEKKNISNEVNVCSKMLSILLYLIFLFQTNNKNGWT